MQIFWFRKQVDVNPKNQAGFAGNRSVISIFTGNLLQHLQTKPQAPIGSERQKRNADAAFHAPATMKLTKTPIGSERQRRNANAAFHVPAAMELIKVCASPNYMSTQTDINEKMRGILGDCLIEMLLDEPLFLAADIIDRFSPGANVVGKKLLLVAVIAMLLECKYEEVNVPAVEDLILICSLAYTRPDILEMERMIVNTLQFLRGFTDTIRKYVFSVAAIGCAYTLLLIPFAVITIARAKVIGGNGVAVMFLIFTDVVFCALFATGGAAGLGYTVDVQRSFQNNFGSVLNKFFRSVEASCALLLAAAVCMVIMVMISVYSK